MTADQCQAFMSALEAAEVTNYSFDTDLSNHLRNDGVKSIAKPIYDKECIVCFRSNKSYGGSQRAFDSNIEFILADFGDVHEVRCGLDYKQAETFVEALGGIDLTEEEFNILLEIDGHNYNVNPITGNYVDTFHYLSQKQLDELTPEEREEYEENKRAYEEAKAKYLPPHNAAMVL